MRIYKATIGNIVERIKAYFKEQDERATINKHLSKEREIKKAFYIHRKKTGNYYLMCNEVYLEAFSKETRLEDVEKRLATMVEASLECYRKEH